MNQQKGENDLGDPAQKAKHQKLCIGGWQGDTANLVQSGQIDQGKGQGVEKADIGCTTGRQTALQVLLQG